MHNIPRLAQLHKDHGEVATVGTMKGGYPWKSGSSTFCGGLDADRSRGVWVRGHSHSPTTTNPKERQTMSESVGTIIAESLDRVVAATRKAVLQEVWNQWRASRSQHFTASKEFDKWIRAKVGEDDS